MTELLRRELELSEEVRDRPIDELDGLRTRPEAFDEQVDRALGDAEGT